jgi:hypothetical protein
MCILINILISLIIAFFAVKIDIYLIHKKYLKNFDNNNDYWEFLQKKYLKK